MGRGSFRILLAAAALCAPAAAHAATYGYCADNNRPRLISTLFTLDGPAESWRLAAEWSETVGKALNVRAVTVSGRCVTGADRDSVQTSYRATLDGIDEYLVVFAPAARASTAQGPRDPIEYQRMRQAVASEQARQRAAAQAALSEFQARVRAHAETLRRHRAAQARYQSALVNYHAENPRRTSGGSH